MNMSLQKRRGAKNKSLSHRKENMKLQNLKIEMHLEKQEVNRSIIDFWTILTNMMMTLNWKPNSWKL
jgi:hypothetical protein